MTRRRLDVAGARYLSDPRHACEVNEGSRSPSRCFGFVSRNAEQQGQGRTMQTGLDTGMQMQAVEGVRGASSWCCAAESKQTHQTIVVGACMVRQQLTVNGGGQSRRLNLEATRVLSIM